MTTFIALFRGINVGGKNKLPMRELRDTFSQLGFTNVRSYIQSGNIIFDASHENRRLLQSEIQRAIKQGYGFEPSIMVLDREAMKSAKAANPYSVATTELNTVHLYFLSACPDQAVFQKAKSLAIAK